MAVQKSKKSRSRRGMRRSHEAVTSESLSVDPVSGETHRRHQVAAYGVYKCVKVIAK